MASLKNLARRPIRARDLLQFVFTVKDLPDQAVALVATAWVERNLERVIRSRMVRLTKTRYRELFVALGPLASLSAKTKLAYAMRIVGRTGVTDLDLIREIRNQFAHSFHPLTFRTREIAKACRRLRTPEAGVKSMRRAPSKGEPERRCARKNVPRTARTAGTRKAPCIASSLQPRKLAARAM